MPMDVIRFHDPAKYAALATPLLMRHEAENCFFLGALAEPRGLADALLCVVRDDRNEPVAAATMTPGRHLVITRAPAGAVPALARFLHRETVSLPGVGGVREAAAAFAREWAALTGTEGNVHVEMGLHRLSNVVPPPSAPGRMRVADLRDIDLVARWITDFRIEIGEGRLGDGRAMAVQRVPQRAIFLWDDDHGEPIAMAGFSGPTPNGVRVNIVYTLPAHRGRGYASNLVAALSQHLLDSGKKFCFLYTDLANPTSNKIYRQVGYEPIGESVVVLFDGPAAPQ